MAAAVSAASAARRSRPSRKSMADAAPRAQSAKKASASRPSSDAEDFTGALDDDGMSSVGLDTMSDNHLIDDRTRFIQTTIAKFDVPIVVEGATGAFSYTEFGDVYVNDILIKGAIYCPTSPFHLLSVGRFQREHPRWLWTMANGGHRPLLQGPGALAR